MGVLVLGAAYRGGVKETAFSGVFATVGGAARPRARCPYVSDPMYTASRAGRARPAAVRGRAESPPPIVQADHAEYRSLTAATCPGVTVLVDGRRTTDPERLAGHPPGLVIGG